MSGTLILNASYEPLAVVPMRRAMLLVLNGKASVVEAAEGWLHSRSARYAVPSVVLLQHYVRIPLRPVPLTRRAALQRYGYRCAYCRDYGDTLDHVVPRSRGGGHSWGNVVVACRRCNHKKADKMLAEIGWRLPFELTEPVPTPQARAGLWSTRHPEWAQYLGSMPQPALLAG
ncbi:HNH endonuclease [Agromyces mediolanus]|uniref:HNH endonuclease n=1 Tax=Agromyces mediolanus TaxID=41986 RepID=UPI00203B1AF3|nr:HNH endonuclease [Agromyces mediolanus]MCM3655854.1 HNH endonuclease [Agromyces mediolanus]